MIFFNIFIIKKPLLFVFYCFLFTKRLLFSHETSFSSAPKNFVYLSSHWNLSPLWIWSTRFSLSGFGWCGERREREEDFWLGGELWLIVVGGDFWFSGWGDFFRVFAPLGLMVCFAGDVGLLDFMVCREC